MVSIRKEHFKKFGIETKEIGIQWDNEKQLIDNILNAIETNKPYNEYNLLSKEEQKAYDEGSLLF